MPLWPAPAVLAAAVLLAACGSYGPDATPTPQPTLPDSARPIAGPSLTPMPVRTFIYPSQDNTIFEGQASTSNGAGVHLFAGNTARGEARRALLKFDVGGLLPDGAVVTSASLRLPQTKAKEGVDPTTFDLYPLTAGWGEGSSYATSFTGGKGTDAEDRDATWTQRVIGGEPWLAAGGDFLPASRGQATLEFPGPVWVWGTNDTLVADVQSWIDAPETNHGWIVIGDETHGTTARQFGSREGATIEAPRLVLTWY